MTLQRPSLHILPALVLGIACLVPTPALAASKEPTQILFEPKTQFPAQGGPAIKVAFLPTGTGLLVGGVGGVVLGDSVGVGLGGYSLSTEVRTERGGIPRDLGMSYGGLILENSFLAHRLFYLNMSIMAGPGQAYAITRDLSAEREVSTFFLVEPAVNFMLNVTRELRLGLGMSYRLTAGSDTNRVLNTDLTGFACTFTLLYGKL